MHLHSHSDVKLPPESSRFLLAGCIMYIMYHQNGSTVSKLHRNMRDFSHWAAKAVRYVAMSCRSDFVFSCVFSLFTWLMTHDQKDVQGPQSTVKSSNTRASAACSRARSAGSCSCPEIPQDPWACSVGKLDLPHHVTFGMTNKQTASISVG